MCPKTSRKRTRNNSQLGSDQQACIYMYCDAAEWITAVHAFWHWRKKNLRKGSDWHNHPLCLYEQLANPCS